MASDNFLKHVCFEQHNLRNYPANHCEDVYGLLWFLRSRINLTKQINEKLKQLNTVWQIILPLSICFLSNSSCFSFSFEFSLLIRLHVIKINGNCWGTIRDFYHTSGSFYLIYIKHLCIKLLENISFQQILEASFNSCNI